MMAYKVLLMREQKCLRRDFQQQGPRLALVDLRTRKRYPKNQFSLASGNPKHTYIFWPYQLLLLLLKGIQSRSYMVAQLRHWKYLY